MFDIIILYNEFPFTKFGKFFQTWILWQTYKTPLLNHHQPRETLFSNFRHNLEGWKRSQVPREEVTGRIYCPRGSHGRRRGGKLGGTEEPRDSVSVRIYLTGKRGTEVGRKMGRIDNRVYAVPVFWGSVMGQDFFQNMCFCNVCDKICGTQYN